MAAAKVKAPATLAEPKSKMITVVSVVDIVGALSTETLEGNIYFMDTNKAGGSKDLGTESVKTAVKKGDRVIWGVQALECEAFAAIHGIIIDKDFCEPERKVYPGTDVSYWMGTVKKDIDSLSYHIQLKVGTRTEPMTTVTELYLIGANA